MQNSSYFPHTMVYRFLVLFVVSFLAVACAETKLPSQANMSHPSWILNPDKPGYIGIVAAAPKQERGGREAQYRVAQMKAYQELAQMQQVQVTSTNRMLLEDRGGKVTRNLDVETQLQSRVALGIGEARVIEEWVDPKNGDLYIWLVVPK